MSLFPALETDRLVLRAFTMDDVPEVVRLAGAWEVFDTTLLIPHPYEPKDGEAWIATQAGEFEAGNGVTLAITGRGDSGLLGAIGLDIRHRHDRGELGYWIGRPYWNKGYATEAGHAMQRYGFETFGLHRIYAHHFLRNPASGRVLAKLGMKMEGTLREHLKKGDGYEDCVSYGILRSEYVTALLGYTTSSDARPTREFCTRRFHGGAS